MTTEKLINNVFWNIYSGTKPLPDPKRRTMCGLIYYHSRSTDTGLWRANYCKRRQSGGGGASGVADVGWVHNNWPVNSASDPPVPTATNHPTSFPSRNLQWHFKATGQNKGICRRMPFHNDLAANWSHTYPSCDVMSIMCRLYPIDGNERSDWQTIRLVDWRQLTFFIKREKLSGLINAHNTLRTLTQAGHTHVIFIGGSDRWKLLVRHQELDPRIQVGWFLSL